MRPIVWLASYPKSGNTWMRLLLANLDADRPIGINALRGLGGIASGRARFDDLLLFPSGLLTHAECDRCRPLIYREMARQGSALQALDESDEEDDPTRSIRFVKTHDAWTVTSLGEPLLGGRDAAAGAILIVRDPRAVLPSLASHNGRPIDDAIGFLGDPEAAFCGRTDRQPNQLRQQLPGWSGYHRGWLEQAEVPLHVVRYEDLHSDPAATLGEALAFAGITIDPVAIERAVRRTRFADVARQERESGFREASPRRRDRFFRRGLADGWRDELTIEQIRRVERDHGAMMARFGYELSASDGAREVDGRGDCAQAR